MWDMELNSKPELNVQYRQPTQNEPHSDGDHSTKSNDSEDSKKAPLLSPKRIPGKITPSKLEITVDDKIHSKLFKKQLTCETIASKAPEPGVTLKPQWDIIENGTITKYKPLTRTLDTDTQKKRPLAIVAQPLPSHRKQTSPPKRYFHMVACKSLREYNNQEKTKQFCFEEKKEPKNNNDH